LSLPRYYDLQVGRNAVTKKGTHGDAFWRRFPSTKLAYAMQLGAIHEALGVTGNINGDQLAKAVASKEMTFKLSNLTSGKVAEIENRNYADFVTPPGGWLLHIGTGTFSYSGG
jgi:hypothetical protein